MMADLPSQELSILQKYSDYGILRIFLLFALALFTSCHPTGQMQGMEG
jgi:hypothetical protein